MRPPRGRLRRWLRYLLPWLRWGTVAVLSLLLVLDLAFPPPLPRSRDTGTLVVAGDGTPLRAFADAQGVWRYPADARSVSPLYLQALLTYEDRWFWRHPGVNPWALLRAGGQMLAERRIVSGGSTLTMQVARILDPHTRTPWGKAKQLLRALQLEVHLDKAQILGL
ncbi:MAG: transglycosylase domain-containing protein, partial [Stenotrophomonas acidaminiphila]|nr:transglycosylase domain-containing protein [Stenotrophomonas acidaminiphila]